MRAYIFLQTRLGATKEVIENLRNDYEQCFKEGNTLYGWYDGIVELDIPNTVKLNEIIDNLKHNCLEIIHVSTAVEKPDNHQSYLIPE